MKATPTPFGDPTRELGGITFYRWDVWNGEKRSRCASQNPEGPFLGAAALSVSDADLPQITVPQIFQVTGVRMCKLEGVTVLNYLLTPDLHIELIVGPHEWPINAPLDSLTVQSTAEGDVVVAPTTEEFPYEGVNAARVAPFGLVLAYGGVEAYVVSAVAGLDVANIEVPLGKDIFTGDINGIHFESEFSDSPKECTYSAYGFIGGDQTTAPDDPRLLIEPGYLPPGQVAVPFSTYWTCGNVETSEASYRSDPASGGDYWITRMSGSSTWFSLYSEDWYTPATVAGLDVVLRASPPGLADDTGAELLVRESFGLTAILGPDPVELIKIAEGLNR